MRKFNADSYRPTHDSSESANGALRRKHQVGGHVVLVVPFHHCYCGCGRETIRDQAIFVQGHDAKLRSKLIRAEITDTPVAFIIERAVDAEATSFDTTVVKGTVGDMTQFIIDAGPHTSGREAEYWHGTIAHSAARYEARKQAKAAREAKKEEKAA